MKNFNLYCKKLHLLCSGTSKKIFSCCKTTCFIFSSIYHSILFKISPILTHILYFIFLFFFGFWILKVVNPRTITTFRPRNIDLFFTSVSTATVSSMSTVEMEVFSNPQLIVMTILMFVGGEVFTSMVGLHLIRPKYRPWRSNSKVTSISSNSSPCHSRQSSFHDDQIELDIITITELPNTNHNNDSPTLESFPPNNKDSRELKYDSIKLLGTIALGYLLLVNIVGTLLVLAYMRFTKSAHNVLREKGLKLFTFSIFTSISTFASCGFVPTNENMIVFSKNSGLLLILIPQVLLGNTLYPVFLRLSIWFVGKLFKKQEANFLLTHSREIGHLHLLPGWKSLFFTVLGFILVQFSLFCSLEWNSSSLHGLNAFQKIVGVLFQVVNSRHTGETIVDLSTISPAMLVLFIVMMYLPPYTSFKAVKGEEQYQQEHERRKQKARRVDNIIFSQLSYLALFIILVCITERKKMKDDPLNFNVLSITLEVISAYGNVGFTMGYSCGRMVKHDPNCKDKMYGLVGKWSDEGKIVLIIVMLFGRLKKFNSKGGKAWKLM